MLALALVLAVNPLHAEIDAQTSREDWRLELRRICQRESRCRLIGYHAIDSWVGASRYAGAVRRGLLDPEECPEAHAREPIERWGTVGPFGQSGVAVGHLAGCHAPEEISESRTVATAVAVATFAHYCGRGACSCRDRVRIWVGVGKWRGLSHTRRLRSYRRQCGEPPGWWYLGTLVDGVILAGSTVRKLLASPFVSR